MSSSNTERNPDDFVGKVISRQRILPKDPIKLNAYMATYHKKYYYKQKESKMQNLRDDLVSQLQKIDGKNLETLNRSLQTKIKNLLIVIKELNGDTDVIENVELPEKVNETT